MYVCMYIYIYISGLGTLRGGGARQSTVEEIRLLIWFNN